MSDMTAAEKVELALIPLVGASVWAIAQWLPDRVGVGSLLLAASVSLLLQGLIRDLWLLSKGSRNPQASPRQEALCMCVESTVGVTGVVASLVILGSSVDSKLVVSHLFWSILAVVVLAIGFVIKDFVFEWRPLRIRRDKNHVNIVFSWKN